MNSVPKGPQAARLRQRKFELLARFNISADLLPGSVSLSHFRCGKPNCHCAQDEGHPAWSFTYMVNGKKRVQHIPQALVPEIHTTSRRRARVSGGSARSTGRQCAVVGSGAEAETPAVRRPTPYRLLQYVRLGLRLKLYLELPGDGRRFPPIPAKAMLWAILLGQILRES